MAGGRNAWLVWGVSIATYAAAVMQRSSLGVAGQEAAAHFGTTISVISAFVMLQLGIYGIMQVPIGAILDKFGSRALFVIGSLIMGCGQITIATADVLWVAVLARLLVGLGDGCIFGSALRLLPAWFPPKRVPILSQLTGLLGLLGQLAAVGALLPAVRAFGWMQGMLGAAVVSFLMAFCCVLVVRNAPTHDSAGTSGLKLSQLHTAVSTVLKHPATRLGFFVHLASGFSAQMFMVMWGMPYLLIAQQRSPGEASALFSVVVFGSFFFAPVLGHLTARHPLRRSNLALGVVFANLLSWLAVLLWPGAAPTWLLVVLLLSLSAGGPGTSVGFDYARTLLPYGRMGTANGVIISGSFGGATVCLLVIAAMLQAVAGDQDPTPSQLNWAMAIQIPFFLIGIAGIYLSRAQLRRMMAREGVIVPTWVEVAHRIRNRRRH